MAEYNPFKDFNPNFTYYTAPKVELVNPFDDSITDISSWASSILPNGNIRVSPNTPEAAKTFDTSFIDENAKSHSEPYQEDTQNNSQKTYTAKQDLQGNKKRAMEFFQSKGLNAHQAAGLVGNLIRESSLNPGAVNKTSGAYGIAQWLGSRKKSLFSKYGKNPTFDQQLDFVWEELNSTHKKGLEMLKQSLNVDEAAANAFGWYEFSVGPKGAIQEMKKYGQDGLKSYNQGIKFSRELLS